ncbi:MAG: RNA-binding S4 domain-containing protein [Acidobacteria bacterium]|jgi:ribosomal 50S subunit-recycling heat shock protein|nr:RNA-binding S4 domain-containing protein [Acidobacteriota bacterium]
MFLLSIIHFPLSIQSMRLDLFLKASRLIIRRSLAQKFCDAGMVKVNDLTAKSSREVKPDDEIEIKKHNRLTKVKVLQVPDKKQVSRSDAANLYEIVSEEILEDEI